MSFEEEIVYWKSVAFGLALIIATTGVAMNILNHFIYGTTIRLSVLTILNVLMVLGSILIQIGNIFLYGNLEYQIVEAVSLILLKSLYITMFVIYMQLRCISLLKPWQIWLGNLGHIIIFVELLLTGLEEYFGYNFDSYLNILNLLVILTIGMLLYHIYIIFVTVSSKSERSLNKKHKSILATTVFQFALIPILISGDITFSVFPALGEYTYFRWVFVSLTGLIADAVEFFLMINKYRINPSFVWLVPLQPGAEAASGPTQLYDKNRDFLDKNKYFKKVNTAK